MFNKHIVRNIVIIGAAAIVLFYLPMFFQGKDWIVNATLEDHFYENFSAIVFFLASGLFLYDYITAKNDAGKRNLFFLLFALAFFFAAGEEISWGQRIFHFATPAAMEGANAQGEFNLHNLGFIQHEHGLSGTLKSLLNFNRFFILFYIVYTILIPLANLYSARLRGLFARFRLPIVSTWFGFLFVLNEVICKAADTEIIQRLHFNSSVEEVKESLWALTVFLMGVYFLYEYAGQAASQRRKVAETA